MTALDWAIEKSGKDVVCFDEGFFSPTKVPRSPHILSLLKEREQSSLSLMAENHGWNEKKAEQKSVLRVKLEEYAEHGSEMALNHAKWLIWDGETGALHCCAECSGLSVMLAWLLSDATLDPTEADAAGLTALHIAAAAGHRRNVVTLLRDDRVDLNALDHGGQTPLISAVIHGRRTIVAVLLSNSADKSISDHSGNTAEDYARISGDHWILDCLERWFLFKMKAHSSSNRS